MFSLKNIVLATDMDGTLVSNFGGISEKNLSSIKKFLDMGGNFCIATGRTTISMSDYFRLLQPYLQTDRGRFLPAILFNGSAIYDYSTNKYIHTDELPDASIRKIAREAIKDYPKVGVEFIFNEMYYVVQSNWVVEDFIKCENITHTKCDIDDVPRDCLKVLFGVPDGLMPEFSTYIKNKLDGQIDFVQSSPYYLEMLPKNITKGSALLKLCEICSLDISNVIAVGDYDNDIGMIKSAGLGIALKNASENLKNAADICLNYTNEQDAISKIIEYILKFHKST